MSFNSETKAVSLLPENMIKCMIID